MDKKINLEWYRTFKEIYQCQTITDASNKLGLTQPAVSLQLSNFEKVLNKKLFDRTSRKMIPTEYAKILYSQVVDLIEKLDNIQKLVLENSSKVINLGCPHEFFDSFLIDKISNFDFRINIEFGLTNNLLEKLKSGDLNIVIATKKINKLDLIYKEIFTETILLVGNNSINTIKFNEFIYNQDYDSAEKFLSQLICYAYSSDLPLIKRFWKNNFVKRPNLITKATVPNLNSLINLIINTPDSFSLIPDYLCKEQIKKGTIKEIWQGRESTTNKIYMAFNKDFEYEHFFNNIR